MEEEEIKVDEPIAVDNGFTMDNNTAQVANASKRIRKKATEF